METFIDPSFFAKMAGKQICLHLILIYLGKFNKFGNLRESYIFLVKIDLTLFVFAKNRNTHEMLHFFPKNKMTNWDLAAKCIRYNFYVYKMTKIVNEMTNLLIK